MKPEYTNSFIVSVNPMSDEVTITFFREDPNPVFIKEESGDEKILFNVAKENVGNFILTRRNTESLLNILLTHLGGMKTNKEEERCDDDGKG